MTVLPYGSQAVLLATLALVACSTQAGHTVREPEPPPITIRVEPGPRAELTVDSARYLPAQPVRFSALLDPDLNHPTAITATQQGRLRWVRARAEVAPRDSLAVVVRSRRADPATALLTEREGTWWPRAQAGVEVWPGDVVGLLQTHGLALAVGSVPEYDAEFIHTGDSAVVRFPDRSGPPHRGRVERLRFPEPGHGFTVDVWVEIRHVVLGRGSRLVEVEVVPTGLGDSLYAVPVSAVAQLSQGAAVFVPLDSASFRVQWVVTGRHAGDLVMVRRGMNTKVPLAVDDLARLVTAAEDSLRVAPRS